MEIKFLINNQTFSIDANTITVNTSLNTFIREHAGLTGTKFMCLEGGCGACVVMVTEVHPLTKIEQFRAVNSCLLPVLSCHGLEITTIEAIGNRKDGYDPLQKQLVKFNGTQCGYCTPGMLMNMISLYKARNGRVTVKEIENSFGGNICRCTGYRSILDTMKSFAMDADKNLLGLCGDIEDIKICSKLGKKCKSICGEKPKSVHLTFPKTSQRWHKVYHLREILEIFRNIGDEDYMLVGGNNAHGIYRRSQSIQIFIDVSSVEELRSHIISANEIQLGANITITETMALCEQLAVTNSNFKYLQTLWQHFDLIANVPVRNFATLAGNLAIKHQHNEFPSDVFITLEAIGAKLTIVDMEMNSQSVTPAQFLRVDMRKKVISTITLPALVPGTYHFRSYKIMPRAQNAHAYVNAGFLLKYKENQITSANICFGGISPEFIHAEAAEEKLLNDVKRLDQLYDNDTILAVVNELADCIVPDSNLEDASPEYRKQLSISLFYKFLLDICPDDKLQSQYVSGRSILDRKISSGSQTYQTQQNNWPLTEPVEKLEGIYQCSGEALYINDMPKQKNELWAAFVPGTKVGHIIGKIDASRALNISGVEAFYSAKDIPGVNSFTPPILAFLTEDEQILSDGTIGFYGQPVGIIVATSFQLANEAAQFIDIEYINPKESFQILPTLKCVLDSNRSDRIFEQPFNQHQDSYQIQGAQTIMHRRLEFKNQSHFHMEPQTCICIPNESSMDVYSSTQWMDLVQLAIARCLNLPESRINVSVLRLGGGFGGKISRATQIACACAIAAHHLNRPVRFVMQLESNMTVVGKRYGCLSNYSVGFNANGKIETLKNVYYQDYGIGLNETVQFYTTPFATNCYDGKEWEIKGLSVKTDAAKNTWCRGPGATEAIAMMEHILEDIAVTIDREPADVRLENMPNDSPIKSIFTEFLTSVEYRARKAEINLFNRANRWRKRGIAAMPMKYVIEYFSHFSAFVAICHGDGTVAISHGGIEMGQGLNTKAAQVAAHMLGVPIELVSVKASNSLIAANSTITGGSIASEAVCFAVKKSCEILLDRLKPTKLENPNMKWEEITHTAYNKDIDLRATYEFKAADAPKYFAWGSCCAEVEVDVLTGNYIINRVDLLEDVGESMNPLIDVGQVEGAFVMGLGYWLTEKLTFNRENGELLTNRTWNYKPPGAKDIPVDFRIKFLANSSNKGGVLRSKTTGELALTMAVVAVFAIRHAITSARLNAGFKSGLYEVDYPMSPESVFLSCKTDLAEFKLGQE